MSYAKRTTGLLLFICLSSSLISCASKGPNMTPQVSQMKAITELATMEVYYHNVAKHEEKDASGILFWKKDKHFWIEYSGIVKLGIDPSKLEIKIDEDTVTINIPDAEVFDAEVDQKTLKKESFIVAKNSAEPEGEDETAALASAQKSMKTTASQDNALLASAKQRAQKLMGEYISNIGQVVGKEYILVWVDSKNKKPEKSDQEGITSAPDSSTTAKDD